MIDKTGAGVGGWQTGQRMGVGWHGGHCRHGDFVLCKNALDACTRYHGGYAH